MINRQFCRILHRSSVIQMESESEEFLVSRITSFISKSNDLSIDRESKWMELRAVFIDYSNKKLKYILTSEEISLINTLKSLPGFDKFLSLETISRVFPGIDLKFPNISRDGDARSLIRINLPSFKCPKSARPIGISTPSLIIPKKQKKPTTPRPLQGTSQKCDASQCPKQLTFEEPADEKTAKILSEIHSPRQRWDDNIQLRNEGDVFVYLAAKDPKSDFLQFHYGIPNGTPYSFKIQERVPRAAYFDTMTLRGVTSVRAGEPSEFTPLSDFLNYKADFEMLKPIRFFPKSKCPRAQRLFFLTKWHIGGQKVRLFES